MRAPLKLLIPAALLAHLLPGADWTLARNTHFEIYAQDGEPPARSALLWFEQLRAAVLQETGLDVSARAPIRVIGFHSDAEYAPYRIAPEADAYYLGAGDREYIVVPSFAGRKFAIAAHEFAHLVQHTAESHLPPWLSEGLADVFSTVAIDKRGGRIGGEVPGRLDVLRTHQWMPLSSLLAFTRGHTPSPLFYAQSWALTDMLTLSPEYRPQFGSFVNGLKSGSSASAALQSAFGKSLDRVSRDLSRWVAHRRFTPVPLATADPDLGTVTVTPVPASTVQVTMAQLLLAAGELDAAESVYRQLTAEHPELADPWAGLGAIAAGRKQLDAARALWKRAIDLGLTDPGICYRYAELMDRDGRQQERRDALQRAVALRPDFDDARWMLALIEANSGRFEAALAQMQAMREVTPARAYSYWCAMADTLTALGRNEEAQAAARHASEHAVTGEEREHAAQLAFTAKTHLAVRLSRDAAGNTRMVTTRVLNDDVQFNPFVEPQDDLQRVQGTLREIDCGSSAMRISVETAKGKLSLTIPDPSRVLMRNAPAEFVCGPQHGETVIVEYAATNGDQGVVRGLEFR